MQPKLQIEPQNDSTASETLAPVDDGDGQIRSTQKQIKKRPAPTVEQPQEHEPKRRKRGRPPTQNLVEKKPARQLRSRSRRQAKPPLQQKTGRKTARGVTDNQTSLEPVDEVARVSEESESAEGDDCLEGEYWVDRLVAKKSKESKEGDCDVSPTTSEPTMQNDDGSLEDGLWM